MPEATMTRMLIVDSPPIDIYWGDITGTALDNEVPHGCYCPCIAQDRQLMPYTRVLGWDS